MRGCYAHQAMSSEQAHLEAAIAALEAQRAALGDAVVEPLLAAARARLEALQGSAVPEPAQALKQVSILFLDVVGSTTLSQKLDPEQIGAVMDGALARASALVDAHHGKVLQFAGDSLLAVFGAGDAREDDAERAVRCGLALLELGRALGDEVGPGAVGLRRDRRRLLLPALGRGLDDEALQDEFQIAPPLIRHRERAGHALSGRERLGEPGGEKASP